MTFLAELRRRNVIRMAGLYLVGAWLIVQVVGTVSPMLGAPPWVGRTVLALLAIGFVPALVFAWVFELTPGGLKRDSELPTDAAAARPTARRMDRMIIVVLLLALGYFAVDKFVLAPTSVDMAAEAPAPAASVPAVNSSGLQDAKTTSDPKSIAVLAFADMSADRDNEYFSDGVAEEILNALAKVDDLKVAGRTSSFYFKGRNESLAAIGSTLGVAHVLEGAVRKQGERLRISAKLLRVSDGVEMWADTFDGTDADIFALQETIAQQVTGQLKVALNAGQRGRLIDSGTANPEAYALYLRATDVFNRRAGPEFANAIRQLQQAVALDPGFARAYSRMAALQALWPEYVGTDMAESRSRALANARHALTLQPDFAEPHAVIAVVLGYGDYLGARAEYEKALSIDPDDLASNFWYSVHLATTGYLRERVERLRHVLALDPLLPNALNHWGGELETQGDLDAARRAVERAREVGAANTDIYLGFISLRQGRIDEARAEFARTVEVFGPKFPPGTGAIVADGILDDGQPRARALALVRKLVAEPDGANSAILAWALIVLGAHDEALAMLAERPMNGTAWQTALWASRGEAARSSPAFAEFARKSGLAELWDKYGPPDLCRKDGSGDYRCE